MFPSLKKQATFCAFLLFLAEGSFSKPSSFTQRKPRTEPIQKVPKNLKTVGEVVPIEVLRKRWFDTNYRGEASPLKALEKALEKKDTHSALYILKGRFLGKFLKAGDFFSVEIGHAFALIVQHDAHVVFRAIHEDYIEHPVYEHFINQRIPHIILMNNSHKILRYLLERDPRNISMALHRVGKDKKKFDHFTDLFLEGRKETYQVLYDFGVDFRKLVTFEDKSFLERALSLGRLGPLEFIYLFYPKWFKKGLESLEDLEVKKAYFESIILDNNVRLIDEKEGLLHLLRDNDFITKDTEFLVEVFDKAVLGGQERSVKSLKNVFPEKLGRRLHELAKSYITESSRHDMRVLKIFQNEKIDILQFRDENGHSVLHQALLHGTRSPVIYEFLRRYRNSDFMAISREVEEIKRKQIKSDDHLLKGTPEGIQILDIKKMRTSTFEKKYGRRYTGLIKAYEANDVEAVKHFLSREYGLSSQVRSLVEVETISGNLVRALAVKDSMEVFDYLYERDDILLGRPFLKKHMMKVLDHLINYEAIRTLELLHVKYDALSIYAENDTYLRATAKSRKRHYVVRLFEKLGIE